MIKISSKSKTSDRYWFKDYQEVVKQKPSNVSPTHSLCIGCSDYYDIPPCKTEFTTDSGCFPSLATNDENLNQSLAFDEH